MTNLQRASQTKPEPDSSFQPSKQTKPILWPTFHNREKELDDLVKNLSNPAGDHFHIVLAGPKMGKTWFLKQLAVELTDKDDRWIIKHLDLRDHESDTQLQLEKILIPFFELKQGFCLDGNSGRDIARRISKSGRPWLCLLDSAEFLSENVIDKLRNLFREVVTHLETTGDPHIHLGFVAASRCHQRAWKGIVPPPRFPPMVLTHFNLKVIQDYLRDMVARDKRSFGNDWYRKTAVSLLKATEGLPDLLVQYMKWIRDVGYLFSQTDIEGPKLLNSFVKKYITNHLLSTDSLVPFSRDPGRIQIEKGVLESALLGLSPCRMISMSHLELFYLATSTQAEDLEATGWSIEDLWQAIDGTFLITPSQEIWKKIYPSIRRLLFRYRYTTKEECSKIHQQAGNFLNGWWEETSGTDRAALLLERIWHQVNFLYYSDSSNMVEQTISFAEELLERGFYTDRHKRIELAKHIEERLYEDRELQTLLEYIDEGFFAKLLEVIARLAK